MDKKRSLKTKLDKTNKQKDDTRQIAFEAICLILEKSKSLDVALQTSVAQHAEIRDRAAAYRLIVCFLRKKGTLEAIVEPLLKRAPPPKLLWIILMGVAQMIFLEVPAHAAINTSVELARYNGFHAFTGLVNAVLRSVMRHEENVLEDLDQERLNMPEWLWREWNRMGFSPRQLSSALNQEPPLDMTIKPGITAPEGGQVLFGNTVRYPLGTKVNNLAGYEDGQFWVQDIAATIPALLLNAQKCEKVADLCAAPGGKTAQLIVAGADVLAVEKDPERTKQLKENLDRLQLSAQIITADAGKLSYQDEFDAILLDAPCSATGIFRRHPDVLHIKKEKDITALAKLQRQLVYHSLKYLKKGGRLIYSVCSLHPHEAEEQIQHFQKIEGFQFSPFTVSELPWLPQSVTEQGWVRTFPFMLDEKGGMDGFFVARFIKK